MKLKICKPLDFRTTLKKFYLAYFICQSIYKICFNMKHPVRKAYNCLVLLKTFSLLNKHFIFAKKPKTDWYFWDLGV